MRTASDPPPVPGPDPGPTNTSPSAPTPVPRAHTALISSTDHSAGVVWRLSTMTKSCPTPSSCRSWSRLDAAEPGHQSEPGNDPHGFPHDRPVHLALPLGSVDEHDRDFLQGEPFAPCPHAHFDLKGVPVRPHPRQVDRLEHAPAKALEPSGQVPDPETCDPTGVDVRTI